MSQRNRQEFIIFLQNTDHRGAEIAWQRYEDELRQRFTVLAFPFQVEILPVRSSVEETLKQRKVVDQ
ncbi:hypothetical protein OVA29_13420 [Exiguobacterium sp. SL14]|nr:hypothetical protein [Exiguobacterium sp. SL14]MCY1691563.1 hypothetical protein [Exiguobacterium sp. SL14]